jgi:hypothetical protein
MPADSQDILRPRPDVGSPHESDKLRQAIDTKLHRRDGAESRRNGRGRMVTGHVADAVSPFLAEELDRSPIDIMR